jgi:hypothetical protein
MLNQIFDMCRRTADVLCQDWYICDAQREQNRWVEPFQGWVYLQAYGKVEMLRSTIEAFSRDQFSNGFIPSTSPSIFETEDTKNLEFNQYLFSAYGLPFMVYLDWLYGGNDDRQNHWLDVSDRCFNGIFQYLGPDGVLVNMPGSHFVEWSALDTRPSDCGKPVEESSEVTFYNAFAVFVLERMSDLALEKNRNKLADKWREMAGNLREAANKRYYNEKYEAYIDGIYDGIPSESVSQTTNAMAILARLGNSQRLKKVIKTTKDPNRSFVPCTIASMVLYNEALESIHNDDDISSVIRSEWGKMLDMDATTTWESVEALERNQGLCFGFSAHPLNYMVRNYLGIVPLKAGYKTFSVRIKPSNLEFAKGKVATPYGYIEVDWRDENDEIALNLTVPTNCKAVVTSPCKKNSHSKPTIIINGKKAELKPHDVAVNTFLREKYPAIIVESGAHKIIMK